MTPKMTSTMKLNGQSITLEIEPRDLLLDVLRDRLDLIGTKRSCDMQVCGSCTVLIDSQPYSACCTLAYEANGKDVLTIEGMAEGDHLHPIQQAFLAEYGLQCGYCTAGMVLTAHCLLKANPNPSEAEVREYMDGNLCRCTGYYPIIAAIQSAAEQVSEPSEHPTGGQQ